MFVAATPSPHSITPELLCGNPYLLNAELKRVDHSFGVLIALLQQESGSQGGSSEGNALLKKLAGWREELYMIRSGKGGIFLDNDRAAIEAETRGGMFTD